MFSLSRRFTAQFSVQSQETIIINGPFYGHFAQSAYHNAQQRLKNKLMHWIIVFVACKFKRLCWVVL